MRVTLTVALTALVAAAGCVADGPPLPDGERPAPEYGWVCPYELPSAADGGSPWGTDDPAPSLPRVDEVTEAWVCRFALRTEQAVWNRVGSIAIVDPADLPRLEKAIGRLSVPREVGGGCTDDLGARYLVVTLGAREELTGYAVDGFGCTDVRLTDDPYRVEAGHPQRDDLPGGVLRGGEALLLIAQQYLPDDP